MRKILDNYCTAKGIAPCEILNGRRDAQSVLTRDALLYLSWLHHKHATPFSTASAATVKELAKTFGFKRNTVYEKLVKFEAELAIYASHRQLLEGIQKEIAPKL